MPQGQWDSHSWLSAQPHRQEYLCYPSAGSDKIRRVDWTKSGENSPQQEAEPQSLAGH